MVAGSPFDKSGEEVSQGRPSPLRESETYCLPLSILSKFNGGRPCQGSGGKYYLELAYRSMSPLSRDKTRRDGD